jgi:hypothetical protein
VSNDSFKSPVTDFYLTNPIARASKTMAECSRLALLLTRWLRNEPDRRLRSANRAPVEWEWALMKTGQILASASCC